VNLMCYYRILMQLQTYQMDPNILSESTTRDWIILELRDYSKFMLDMFFLIYRKLWIFD